MTVVVYSTETCPWCIRAKQFLDEKGVDYTAKDVGSDAEAAKEMVEKSGQRGVPVIDVNGVVVVGFDELRLRQLLGI